MKFSKIFSDPKDVAKDIFNRINNEDSTAIFFWPTEQLGTPEEPPNLDSYIATSQHLECYGLKNNKKWLPYSSLYYSSRPNIFSKEGHSWAVIEEIFFNIILLNEFMQREIGDFIKKPRERGGINGGFIDTEVFGTNFTGLSLQVIYLERWWQSCGGGHDGDFKKILLVNSNPLSLAEIND
jgi:hypothetical protein